MEVAAGIVLPHYPCGRQPEFRALAGCQRNHLRIPAPHRGSATRISTEPARDLRERMLCFPRMLTVTEVACDLVIAERLAEPGGAPEQEWHQDEQECENEDARQQGTGKSRPGSALFARRGRWRWRVGLFCKVHPMRGA